MEQMSTLVKYLIHSQIIRIVILFVPLIISCKEAQKNKDKEEIVKMKDDKSENSSSVSSDIIEKKKKEDDIGDDRADIDPSIIEEVSFLKNQGIIGEKFPVKSVIRYFENKNGDLTYCLLTTNYHKELGSNYSAEPVYNFLYIKKDSTLINHLVIYSIYEDDFKFEYFLDNSPIYNYYDSSTGWSKLLIYSVKENQFFSTKKIDEGLNLEKDGINLDNRKYTINGTNQSELLYPVSGNYPD